MDSISILMGLWCDEHISTREVNLWAEKRALSDTELDDALVNLLSLGPDACIKLPSYEFPAPLEFSFIEKFSLKFLRLDFEKITEVESFIDWLIRTCMGMDLSIVEVSIGYHLDHYVWECNDKLMAIEYLEKETSKHIERYQSIAARIEAQLCLDELGKPFSLLP